MTHSYSDVLSDTATLLVETKPELLWANFYRTLDQLTGCISTRSIARERIDGPLVCKIGFDIVFVQMIPRLTLIASCALLDLAFIARILYMRKSHLR